MTTSSFLPGFSCGISLVEGEGRQSLKIEVVVSLALCAQFIALTIVQFFFLGPCENAAGDVVVTLLCQTRQILLIPTLQPFALQGQGESTTDLTGRVRDMQLVFTLLARSAIQSYTS